MAYTIEQTLNNCAALIMTGACGRKLEVAAWWRPIASC
jgi:hypothetical protein